MERRNVPWTQQSLYQHVCLLFTNRQKRVCWFEAIGLAAVLGKLHTPHNCNIPIHPSEDFGITNRLFRRIKKAYKYLVHRKQGLLKNIFFLINLTFWVSSQYVKAEPTQTSQQPVQREVSGTRKLENVK